jgi:hypothetical protein
MSNKKTEVIIVLRDYDGYIELEAIGGTDERIEIVKKERAPIQSTVWRKPPFPSVSMSIDDAIYFFQESLSACQTVKALMTNI